MTVDASVEAEIRRLFFAEHWKRGTIAAQLSVHADVVTRVTGHLGPSATREPLLVPLALEPFAAFIAETLTRYPRLVGTRVCDMLRDRGYAGSLRSVRRYLRRNRPLPKHEAFLRVEPLVGEQAQVDWAHVGYLEIGGARRALWAFVMVHAYSRALWAELVLDLSVYSLLRSLVRASVHFRGCPRQWVFDNAKVVVVERRGDAIRFHPLLLELAGALRVQPRLCGVRKPHEKGKVERAIRYLRDRFFAGRRIHSVEDGNAALLAFIADIADDREHPRWPERRVRDVLEEERPFLLPLPAPLPPTDLVRPVAADKTAFVRFDRNAYSVPSSAARQVLTLVADDHRVRVLQGEREIASHPRSWGRRERVEDAAHRATLLGEKRAAAGLKGQDRLRAEVGDIETLFHRWIEAGRNAGCMTIRTIRILDLYGADILRCAVARAIERGLHDPGALAVLCEQARAEANRPIPIAIQLGAHVVDRDVVPHDLGGYDE